MSQSNIIVTHIIESSLSSDSGTALFKIPDGVFLSGSAVLSGLGAQNATGTSRYPNPIGCLVSVGRMRLRSGATELDTYDSTQDMQRLAAKCLQSSNQNKSCISRITRRDGWSWTRESVVSSTGGPPLAQTYANRLTLSDQLGTGAATTMQALTNVSTTTPAGNASVSDFLGICQSMPVLPSIPMLSLEVTFVTDAGLYNSATASTIVRPYLIIQEIVGLQLPPVSSYLYSRWMRESFVVPAVANAVAKTTPLVSKAFIGKTVNRMLLANQVADQAVSATRTELGSCSSRAMALESLSVNANYSNLGARDVFPFGGVYSEGLKQYYYTDAFGNSVIPKHCYDYNLTDRTTAGAANDGSVVPEARDTTIGRYSFGGFQLNGQVSALKFTFQRTGDSTADPAGIQDVAALTSTYTVNAYGEVITRINVDRLRGAVSVAH